MLLRRALPLALVLACGPALAQTSQKPIQIIVPFAPGASADGAARIVANELGPRLGRQVVVENKAGAGGTLGLQQIAKSAPDGDTLGVGATGALLLNPNLPSNPGPDLLRELVPVAKLIDVAIVLVANPATGPKTIREMIERSKATPGGLAYGSTGTNTSQHLSVELLKQATGANLVHVPYRGSAPGGGRSAGRTDSARVGRPHLRLPAHPGRPTDRARARRQQALSGRRRKFPPSPKAACRASAAPPGSSACSLRRERRPRWSRSCRSEVAAILATPGAQTTARALTSATAYEDDEAFARFLAAEIREVETGAVVAEFVELTEVVTPAYSRCHSGAPRSGEPGIHTPRPWLWIPAPRCASRLADWVCRQETTSPGMTAPQPNQETRMPLMSGGDAVVRSVLAHGISTIYCLPGVQSDHLFNAMFDAGDALSVVHTRHEQGAAYMALGAALATGKPAAYSVVPGPGFLNSTAALATAYSTGARVLALIGQIPSRGIGKGHGLLHEIPDQIGILRKLTKWAERVGSPQRGARCHRPRLQVVAIGSAAAGRRGSPARHAGGARRGRDVVALAARWPSRRSTRTRSSAPPLCWRGRIVR